MELPIEEPIHLLPGVIQTLASHIREACRVRVTRASCPGKCLSISSSPVVFVVSFLLFSVVVPFWALSASFLDPLLRASYSVSPLCIHSFCVAEICESVTMGCSPSKSVADASDHPAMAHVGGSAEHIITKPPVAHPRPGWGNGPAPTQVNAWVRPPAQSAQHLTLAALGAQPPQKRSCPRPITLSAALRSARPCHHT